VSCLLLHALTPQGVRLVGEALASPTPVELGPEHQVPLAERDVGDLAGMCRVVAASGHERSQLDGLIAPKLHAALPLGRDLGARSAMWAWLAATMLRPLLQRRWAGEDGAVPRARALGPLTDHGLARLWWAAELTVASGAADPYWDTGKFAKGQYLMDRLLKSNLSRNSTLLLGILDGLGESVDWRRINETVGALGVIETTVCLDALTRAEVAGLVRDISRGVLSS